MALAVGTDNSSHPVMQVNNFCIALFTSGGALKDGYPKRLGDLFKQDDRYVFDPRAVYDWVNRRYVIVASERAVLGQDDAHYWIAISKDDSSGGDYHVYRVPMPTGGMNAYADFPRLGQDRDTIYIASNKYGGGKFQYEEWLLLPKSALYRGQDITYWFVYETKINGVLTDTSQPVNAWNPSDIPPAAFFVTSKNPSIMSNDRQQCENRDGIRVCNGLFVWAVVLNPDPLHPLPLISAVAVPTAHDYSLPPTVRQGAFDILAGDTRIAGQVSYAAGSLFPSLTTKTNGERKAAALLFKVQPVLRKVNKPDCRSQYCLVIDSAKITDEALLDYGVDSSFYATTQPDAQGNTLTVFNLSGPNRYPSTAYIIRPATQAPGTFQDSGVVVREGKSAYGPAGWGDYSAVAPRLPPRQGQPTTMWFSGEFTKEPTDGIYSFNWFTVVGFSWANQ
jgi:hypothetical protein